MIIVKYIAAKTIFWDISPFLSTLLPAIGFYFLARYLENVRIFGLTGGIATGKSTLVKQIKDNLQISIIDCDEISRKLTAKNKLGYHLAVKLLKDKA